MRIPIRLLIVLRSLLKKKTSKGYSTVQIGLNCKIHPSCDLEHVNVDSFSYISRNSVLSYCNIGKFCSIGPNVIAGWGIHPINGVSTSPVFYSTKMQCGVSFTDKNKINERSTIVIGNDVFIGMNVIILDGVKIGDGAVIGAGCVVSKDVPPYAVVIGNPMKIIRYRFSELQITKLLEIQWWNKPYLFSKIEEYFFDIDNIIKNEDTYSKNCDNNIKI